MIFYFNVALVILFNYMYICNTIEFEYYENFQISYTIRILVSQIYVNVFYKNLEHTRIIYKNT